MKRESQETRDLRGGMCPSAQTAVVKPSAKDTRSEGTLASNVLLWESAKAVAMHRAVRNGDVCLVQNLLKRGASASRFIPQSDDDVRDDSAVRDGNDLIHLAAKAGHDEIVSLLLRHGADKDTLDSRGRTPLHLAAINGELETVNVLLNTGASVNIIFRDTSRYEHRPLGFASRMGHVDVLKTLLQHGADVNAASSRGLTALHYAAVRNQAGAIDALVEAGADIEARVHDHGGGGTPLHASAVMRCREATRALLRHGANVHVQNVFGFTPLHGVARQGGREGAAETADLLLRSGADELITDRDGNIPVDLVGSSTVAGLDFKGVEMERLRELLVKAPADRAWRRRGYLVMCRAFPERVCLSPDNYLAHQCRTSHATFKDGELRDDTGIESAGRNIQEQSGRAGQRYDTINTAGTTEAGENSGSHVSYELREAATRALGLAEEGLFRHIVSCL